MLILNGIVGLCLFLGGSLKFREQIFTKHSATIALVSLIAIVILTLVFPTFTTSVEGPYYSTPQLIFVSIACLVIYSFFLLAQTCRSIVNISCRKMVKRMLMQWWSPAGR